MFIQNESATLYTVDFGAGPSTILAHGGWTGNWELWAEPFSHLSKTWRTVAFDHRGTGATVAPIESITMENMVSDLFAIMDKLKLETCILAGESSGGMVVVNAVLQQPHRFEGLILVDALLHNENKGDTPFIQGLKTNYPQTIAAFIEACIPQSEPLYTEIQSWGRKILGRATAEAAIRLLEFSYGTDVRPDLSKLKIPTLILHGDQDAIVPASESAFAASQIPNSKLLILNGAGHVPTMTHPREITSAINKFFSV